MQIVDQKEIKSLVDEEHTFIANLDLSFWPIYEDEIEINCEKFLDSILLKKNPIKVKIPGNKSSQLNLTYKTVKNPNKKLGHYIVRSLEIKMTSKIRNVEKLIFSESDETKSIQYISPRSFLEDIFEEEVSIFILALTISSGGLLDIFNISLKNDNKEFFNLFSYYPFQTNGELSWNSTIEYGWPKLNLISIEKTLKWITSFRKEIFSSAESRIGIALNALSETLIDKKDLSSTLIWSMVALESLFVEERSNKAKQIDMNSQILLGKRKSYLKKFKELYKTRSKLLHGELPITGMFLKNDRESNTFSVIIEQVDAGSLSLAIVMATLQTLIIEDVKDYSFENQTHFKPIK